MRRSNSVNELDMFLQVYFVSELLPSDDNDNLDVNEEPSAPIEFAK